MYVDLRLTALRDLREQQRIIFEQSERRLLQSRRLLAASRTWSPSA